MTNARLLRGTELRYVLTINLALHGRATIFDQIETLEDQGFAVSGYASKVVSDALRWEMRKDRVRRVRRGLYGPGQMPRSTEHYINQRYRALRDEAAKLKTAGDEAFWDALFGKREAI
jgi:hypothetical protein